MLLLGDVIPDWVDLPAELGGGRRVVESHQMVMCPCGASHEVRELSLGERLFVAECSFKGFLWYRRGSQT